MPLGVRQRCICAPGWVFGAMDEYNVNNNGETTKKTFEELIRDRNKRWLIEAFEGFRRSGSAEDFDELWKHVLRFAHMKLEHIEHNLRRGGGAEDADDWAQEVAIKVWLNLHRFSGDGAAFFSWVHKIAFNKAADAFKGMYRKSQEEVPWYIDGEDGDEIENPKIEAERMAISIHPIERICLESEERYWSIPSEIEGVDRYIASGVMQGFTYKQIAKGLPTIGQPALTVKSIEHRVAKIKKKLLPRLNRHQVSKVKARKIVASSGRITSRTAKVGA